MHRHHLSLPVLASDGAASSPASSSFIRYADRFLDIIASMGIKVGKVKLQCSDGGKDRLAGSGWEVLRLDKCVF